MKPARKRRRSRCIYLTAPKSDFRTLHRAKDTPSCPRISDAEDLMRSATLILLVATSLSCDRGLGSQGAAVQLTVSYEAQKISLDRLTVQARIEGDIRAGAVTSTSIASPSRVLLLFADKWVGYRATIIVGGYQGDTLRSYGLDTVLVGQSLVDMTIALDTVCSDGHCDESCRLGTCGDNASCNNGKCECRYAACGSSCCAWGESCEAQKCAVAPDSCVVAAPETVDDKGDVGGEIVAAADDNGTLHMAYYDATNRDLKYAKGKRGNWHAYTVDGGGAVGALPSLAVGKNGTVHILYYDISNSVHKYLWGSDAEFFEWTFTKLPKPDYQRIPLVVDGLGKAHFVYNGAGLVYAWGQGGSFSHVVVAEGSFGDVDFLLDDVGRVHLVAQKYEGGDYSLLYYWGSPESGWQKRELDRIGRPGRGAKLARRPDGKLDLVYIGGVQDQLRYLSDLGSAASSKVVDVAFDADTRPINVVIDATGTSHLLYLPAEFGRNKLVYAKGTPQAGFARSELQIEQTLEAALLLDHTGQPHVVYYDRVAKQLRYLALCKN